jgi:putative membrane protein insertion efficiency factor
VSDDERSFPQRAAAAALSAPIAVYRRFISPGSPRRCKYEPTCSRYALDALARFGVLRGLVLAAWRLLRCNPWSHGGYDPVQSQRVFKDRRQRQSERRLVDFDGSADVRR